MAKERAAGILISIQVLLFLVGAALSILWVIGVCLRGSWWTNLPMVALLLGSLLVFSYEEVRIGISRRRRERKGDPESIGGVLEAVAFSTWLFLLVNMIATVFKIIRTIKHAL